MHKQLVIARHNENIDWLKEIDQPYVIYDASNEIASSNVVPIENDIYGREANMYLRHIIDNYYNLADYTAFVQANPFDHHADVVKLLNDDWAGHYRHLSDSVICGYRAKKRFPRIEEIFRQLTNKELPETIFWTFGAQFQVSKEIVWMHPLSHYQHCWDVMKANQCYFVDEVCMAHYFEFSWMYIFLNDYFLDQYISKLDMKNTNFRFDHWLKKYYYLCE